MGAAPVLHPAMDRPAQHRQLPMSGTVLSVRSAKARRRADKFSLPQPKPSRKLGEVSAARRSRLHDLRHIDGRLNLPRGGSCQDCRPTFRIEDRGTCLSTPDRGPKNTSVGNLYTRSSKSSSTGPHPVGNLSTLRFEIPVHINKGLIRFIQSKWHVFCYSIDGIIPVSIRGLHCRRLTGRMGE